MVCQSVFFELMVVCWVSINVMGLDSSATMSLMRVVQSMPEIKPAMPRLLVLLVLAVDIIFSLFLLYSFLPSRPALLHPSLFFNQSLGRPEGRPRMLS